MWVIMVMNFRNISDAPERNLRTIDILELVKDISVVNCFLGISDILVLKILLNFLPCISAISLVF